MPEKRGRGRERQMMRRYNVEEETKGTQGLRPPPSSANYVAKAPLFNQAGKITISLCCLFMARDQDLPVDWCCFQL